MTQDQIIELAKQAGFTEIDFYGNKVGTNVQNCLKTFAKLVAEHERDKFCASLRQFHDSISLASDSNAIRARGQA